MIINCASFGGSLDVLISSRTQPNTKYTTIYTVYYYVPDNDREGCVNNDIANDGEGWVNSDIANDGESWVNSDIANDGESWVNKYKVNKGF